jgi:predicted GIY-YIG superfamily endonuclease
MAEHYVYTLVNNSDVVEYVGTSIDPTYRLRQHINKKPSKSNNSDGRFYGRKDLQLIIIASFEKSYDAYLLEGKLKIQNGFEWTERTRVEPSIIHNRKLSLQDAEDIRNSKLSKKELLEKYNIGYTTLWKILTKKGYQ